MRLFAVARIVRDGIYEALERGPATATEIEERMGMRDPRGIGGTLKQLIRDGTVRVHRTIRGTHAGSGRGYRANVYALVDGSIEAQRGEDE